MRVTFAANVCNTRGSGGSLAIGARDRACWCCYFRATPLARGAHRGARRAWFGRVLQRWRRAR